jgi:hypothetical protein
MAGGLKWLAVGLIVGVAATLLVSSITSSDSDLPEQIAEELGCSDGAEGVHPSSAAAAHHAFDGPNGYSWFAATHASRVLGINGCDPVGPATSYLEFSDQMDMSHVLATLDHFGAVCLVGHSVFEGKILNGRPQLKELCNAVGGELKTLRGGSA